MIRMHSPDGLRFFSFRKPIAVSSAETSHPRRMNHFSAGSGLSSVRRIPNLANKQRPSPSRSRINSNLSAG